MKVHKIICPECQSSLTSKAGIEEGTSINCPKCKNKFAVAAVGTDDEIIEDFEVVDDDEEEAPKKPVAKPALKPLSKQRKSEEDDEDEDEDEEEAKKKSAARPALKPLSKQRKPEREDDEDEEDEEEDRTPKKSAAKSTLKPLSKRKSDDDDDEDDDSPRSRRKGRDLDDDDDEDERPQSKRRNRDDDEDDDEPKSGYAKLKSNIYVRASVLGVLLIVMGVLGYMLYEKNRKKSDDGGTAQNDPDDPSKPVIKDDRRPTGQPPKTNPAAVDLAKFQGTWRVVRMTHGGIDAPPQVLAQTTIVISGDQLSITAGKKSDVNRIKLDPSKNPAEIDTTDTANKLEKGIYRFIDNDTIEVCMSDDDRPTTFVSPPNSKIGLLRLARPKRK